MQLAHYSSALTIDDLLKRRLRVSKMTTFNDPFEFSFVAQEPSEELIDETYMRAWAKSGADIRRYHFGLSIRENHPVKRDLREFWSTRFRTLCCSNIDEVGVPDDILMWSHYAEQHMGIRIHFSETFRTHQALGFGPMEYEDSLLEFSVDLLFRSDEDEDIVKFLTKCLRRKAKCWEREREWRAEIPIQAICETRSDTKSGKEHDYIRVESGYITRIDFGIRCSVSDETLSQLRSTYKGVKIYQAARCHETYACRYHVLREEIPDLADPTRSEKKRKSRRGWKHR